LNLFTLFCEEHEIIQERTPLYSPQSNGVAKIKNHTLTNLVNAMLDTMGLSKEWWGKAILTTCHILNRAPIKNKEITPFEKCEKKRVNLSYLCTWGCLAKVNVSINKKRNLGPKIIDCIFIGYVFHNIGYRFLIIKYGVPDMHVGTIMDSRDATFFEDIFPMREDYYSSSKKSLINYKPTDMIEHNEQTLVENLRGDNETSKRSKRPLVMISLCTLWMILLEPLKRHIHLLMQTTGRKQSRVRWIQLCQMELGRLLVDLMGANLLGASGCSRKRLGLMVQLRSIR
jgi:hypothetical protein